MAIDNRYIHFERYEDFKKEYDAGNILDTSVVFIKDTKQIWTHKSGYSKQEWFGTQEEFDLIDNKDEDTLYYIYEEE